MLDTVKYFLPKSVLDFQDADKQTLLHLTFCAFLELNLDSRQQNHTDFIKLVKLLLDNGASPNIKNKWGEDTPLHLAVNTFSIEMMTLLCESGGDIYIFNDRNTSPKRRCAEILVASYYRFENLENKNLWLWYIDRSE